MAQQDILRCGSRANEGIRTRQVNGGDQTQHNDSWLLKVNSTLNVPDKMWGLSKKVCIYRVPEAIKISKPEDYVPTVVSLGPYHHKINPQLSKMDQHKLQAVHRVSSDLKMPVTKLISEIQNLEFKIRECYDEPIDLDGKSLSWMLAMDACFILEFCKSSAVQRSETNPDFFSLIFQSDNLKNSMYYSILDDIIKLENQIPLFVILKLLELEGRTDEYAATELAKMLSKRSLFRGFPFFKFSHEEAISKLKDHMMNKERSALHLLDLCRMVVKDTLINSTGRLATREKHDNNGGTHNISMNDNVGTHNISINGNGGTHNNISMNDNVGTHNISINDNDGTHNISMNDNVGTHNISINDNGGTHNNISMNDNVGTHNISINDNGGTHNISMNDNVGTHNISINDNGGTDNNISMNDNGGTHNISNGNGRHRRSINVALPGWMQRVSCIDILPRVSSALSPDDRRATPSAELLHGAGIKFHSGKIKFEKRRFGSRTLSLPPITITDNTEARLRNLMAYEECQRCSWKPEDTVVSHFVILFDYLIDSEKDASLLRKSGVIRRMVGSDDNIARMFNRIRVGITFTGIDQIEEVMKGARNHYKNQWKVWMSQFKEEHFSKPWYILSLVAAILILGMTAVQTVYSVRK